MIDLADAAEKAGWSAEQKAISTLRCAEEKALAAALAGDHLLAHEAAALHADGCK